MRLILLFGLLGVLFLLSSCKKYQPADSSFFIRSRNITVATTGAQGTSSNKITDLWVYVNGQYIGTYPAGKLIPIPNKNASTWINVFAGIKNNGIADTRIFYPFFDYLTLDTLVEAGKIIEHDFTFKYKAATTFTWMENFDSSAGFSVKDSPISDTKLQRCVPNEAFENGSAVLHLEGDTGRIAQIESSSDGFYLPTSDGNVYLELNYKCNVAFVVGLMDDAASQHVDALTINPQPNWNKIYIQLSTAVSSIITNKYKLYIKFVKDPSDYETRSVYLDNIKLLYL